MELAYDADVKNQEIVTAEVVEAGGLVFSGEARYHWRRRVPSDGLQL